MNYLTILFSNTAYVIRHNIKTTRYYSWMFCMYADQYLYHFIVTFDANEMDTK